MDVPPKASYHNETPQANYNTAKPASDDGAEGLHGQAKDDETRGWVACHWASGDGRVNAGEGDEWSSGAESLHGQARSSTAHATI